MTRQNQASRAPAAGRARQPGIARVVERWAKAWNKHDMPAAAALVAEDVDFVTVAGLWLKGRAEFLRHHADVHRQHLRQTTWTTRACEVRPLGDDLALAHLEWTITGELDPAGTSRPPRSGTFTWVLACIRGAWLIAAAHNTNLRSDTAHRLSGRRQP